MVDKQDKNAEEEYQFPEDEYVQAQAEPESHQQQGAFGADSVVSPANRGAAIMAKIQEMSKNRIVVVVAVIVVVLIVLRLVGGHSTKVVSTATVSASTAAAVPVVATPVVSTPSPEVTNKLSSDEQNIQNNQSTISDLQTKLSNMQQSLDVATEQQSQITTAVAALAKQVQELKAKLAPKHELHKIKAKPVVYYLRAVVPGRAWIYGSNGRQATVARGDNLKQYGRVVAIDANVGKVMTSSGKVIEFSSQDR